MDAQTQVDISKLNDADKNELSQMLANEQQKATMQQTVHSLSDVCWKKCITGKISSGRLEQPEESCAQNCVERWMDSNLAILKHLEALRG
ncbi:mitochondrial import inner membrane translocase subunit TIM8 [Aspergillus awamori]|uniref:Mitochondrial import inner membrane translocase subunit n=6 Tax=Aspergillus TaxID=5052 RepID=A0A3F3Q7Y0_9EURO|nr:import inner membrane translocase subunit TIM8 [Aspergillus niger CBS 513.88]XP_025453051.1 uncharacterized protein BO96DRAFT_413667 [Aspergillus niger CBS 101883]XP_026628332.1 Tim10/DDP family zinc finger-domain-containing protein [Aspergillus welwitschiae]EHA22466.1 hypothetical protein ASPNIDRAFT_192726 [Aspergillus niger ATCC 1015]KAI2825158.1 hypothetical protein CBS115989_117 [Aspergillus niger]RDH20402.1 hypothetical protein M747DRAFT_295600 [Aspergillus niger ATCC 13496]RDK40124.1|eukprot:XP_003188964.1 import inner membrane translocase subunit TIM8 [Aspergillus niger CBS 513.88]